MTFFTKLEYKLASAYKIKRYKLDINDAIGTRV